MRHTPDYTNGIIALHNTDCMEVMAEYPDNYFDLAVVDPPYGIGNFSPKSGSKGVSCSGDKWDIKWNDSIPAPQYFKELHRASKKRIIWGANYYNCFSGGGALIWHKGKINPQFSQCEIASLSFQKKVDYYFKNWQGGGNWMGLNIHPCQKPVELYTWIFHNYSEPGQRILDTHLGSGSSAIAAHYADMKEFVGCEIDNQYFQDAKKRIEQQTKQLTLL